MELQKIDKNSQLLIAGEGEEKEKLLKLAKDLKIADKVKFIGSYEPSFSRFVK